MVPLMRVLSLIFYHITYLQISYCERVIKKTKTKTKRVTHKITYKTTLRYAYKWYDRYFCFDYQNGQQNESCVQVLATFQVT